MHPYGLAYRSMGLKLKTTQASYTCFNIRYVFQKLQQRGLLSHVTVKVKTRPESGVMMKYSTKDQGQTIRVRSRPYFEQEMDNVLHKCGY